MFWRIPLSYPLYLWHWPLLSFLRIRGATLSTSGSLFAIAIATLLAWLTYKYVEHPIRHSLFAKVDSKRRESLYFRGAFASIILITLVGLLTEKGYFLSPRQRLTAEFTNSYAAYSKTFQKNIQYKRCHLDTNDSSDFDRSCYEAKTPKNIILWGDSHAAHLYPGLRSFFDKQTSVVQFSRGCPPIFEFTERPICIKSAVLVRKVIRTLKPDVLIMSAMWYQYDQQTLVKRLSESVAEAKALGAQEVIVVGPFPVWNSNLYEIVAQNFLDQGLSIPAKSKVGLSDSWRIGNNIETGIKNTSAKYVSVESQLCDDIGCTLLLGADPNTDLVTFDNAHLTEKASIFVIDNIIGPLIQRLRPDFKR
jgi:hypothetical protein